MRVINRHTRPLFFLDALRAIAHFVSVGGDAPIWCPRCRARARLSPPQGGDRQGSCPSCSLRWTLTLADFTPWACPPITIRLVDGSCPHCNGRGEILHNGWVWDPCEPCGETGIQHCPCGARAMADVGEDYGGLSCADCLAEELEEAAARAAWRRCIFGHDGALEAAR